MVSALRASHVGGALFVSLLQALGGPSMAYARGPSAAGPTATSTGAAPVGAAKANGDGAGFSAAELQEAEGRFREARTLYEQGKVDEARVKYAQAFAVLDRSAILWNLAVAEFHSGKKLEALRHFNAFIARPDADAADVKRAVDKYIPQSMAVTCHITVRGATGLAITFDDEVQPGATPLAGPLHANPGSHKVAARGSDAARDGADARTLTCAAGETLTVTFGAESAASASPSKPKKPFPAREVTTIALGAGALVSAGLGVAFAIDSQRRDDANAERLATMPQVCSSQFSADCNDWKGSLDAQQSSATAATALYITAGVLGAGAAATWFIWPKPKRETPVTSVGAAPVRGGAMVQWAGSF